MKRFGLLMVLVLVLGLAGTSLAGEKAFGLKAGIDFATLKGDNTDGLESKTGFMAGFFADLPVSESASIQPEVHYVQKGAKSFIDQVDLSLKLDYIEIPVLFKYTVAGETAQPFFLVGPSVAFKMSAKSDLGGVTDDLESVKGTDWGLVFGLGMNMQKFLLEFRYTLGLTEIADDPTGTDDVVNLTGTKNSAFAILVGINF